MSNLTKSRGFKSNQRWQRFITVMGGKGITPPKQPREWAAEGASKCTVRLDRALRDRLQTSLKQLSNREMSLGGKKIKEVDAVNSAIHDWILNQSVGDVIRASEFKLEFESRFDLQDAIVILENYGDHLTPLEVSPGKGAKKHWIRLKAHRTIQRSPAYRRSITIVASIMSGYQVSQYHGRPTP